MPDAATSQTLADGDRVAVMKFTNLSDGSGEAAVNKVDVSALNTNSSTGATCTRVSIRRVWALTSGMSVHVLWKATANVLAMGVPSDGSFYWDLRSIGPISNNAGSGIDGDILFTTIGHSANDTYVIILEMSKTY